jgi:ATP-binding cassette subfamily F protein 3
MLTLQDIAISRGTKVLLESVNLAVFEKQIIGIIGSNGCGKTSLFAAVLGELELSQGEIKTTKRLRIASVAQEISASSISAIDYTISGDADLFKILHQLKQAEATQDYDTVMHCHAELHEMDGYSAEARAAKILHGLGFSQQEMQTPIAQFSGGWRMRLNLAKCLFVPSDLLLLDEPTNHLDMEAIIWLEGFLKNYTGAILMVSHDQDFLDNTVSHIAHIENKHLKLYSGNYSAFETQHAQDIAVQNAQYAKQQAQVAHMKKFVERFRAKASKAKQAQSRLRAIEKMELVEPIYQRSPFHFHFKQPKNMPHHMISIKKADFGYADHVVIKRADLSIRAGERIGLLGINGAGKSTLIKGICGDLQPLAGAVDHAPSLVIGYFAQHQVDRLPLEGTAFSLLKDLDQTKTEKELIVYLASFGFSRDQSLAPLKQFSGGEKSRVALALIIYQRPNLLLLDEPTNHLDLEMRQALTFALQEYVGAMMLVSHDRHLMRTLVDELYLINDGKLQRFDGSVEDYQALHS